MLLQLLRHVGGGSGCGGVYSHLLGALTRYGQAKTSCSVSDGDALYVAAGGSDLAWGDHLDVRQSLHDTYYHGSGLGEGGVAATTRLGHGVSIAYISTAGRVNRAIVAVS